MKVFEKTFNQKQNWFNNLTTEELIDYHREVSDRDPDYYDVVKEALIYCYGDIDYNMINKLHWHFAQACVNKLKTSI